MGVAAGGGATVSSYVAGLALESYAMTDLAEIGILVAALIAASAAMLLLRLNDPSPPSE